MIEGNFNPKTYVFFFFFSNGTPDPFKNCNKNVLQESVGSKWAQVDRKMQKAFKDCAFPVLQGQWFLILQETGHMQMSLFLFFAKQHLHWKDNSKQFQIHQFSEMPKKYAVTSLKLYFRKQSGSVICMFLQVK